MLSSSELDLTPKRLSRRCQQHFKQFCNVSRPQFLFGLAIRSWGSALRRDSGLFQCPGRRCGARAATLPVVGDQLFSLLPSTATGVHFENRLVETRDLNVFTYRNYYNGGGVAIGDLTGDGLPEIVLTSNQGGPRLYLNQGNFRFRDITEAVGLRNRKDSWTTGVTLADVNGDGLLDIYICKAGPGDAASRANELWINQGLNKDGVPSFKEMAAAYGVADSGYSTQAVFFDYDGDGKLDLFVLRNSPRAANSLAVQNTRHIPDPYGGARLYHNDGGHFTDVTAKAGIHSPTMAFGLGVVATDVNNDGRPDLYVSNDFFERDYLYINNGNGTFSDALDRQMPVISYYSMGLDAADLDNDGWPDIYTTDMLPDDEYRLKTNSQFENWQSYQTRVGNGFHHQAMRNMLQRNNRDGTFSDVGQMAGVERTDWSWSALIADFDLDGNKDIFVTNGIAKDLTSQDYVAYPGERADDAGRDQQRPRARRLSPPHQGDDFHAVAELRLSQSRRDALRQRGQSMGAGDARLLERSRLW